MADYSIPLSEAIRALRNEIIEAQAEGEGAPVQFELGPVEVEFQLVVSSEAGADGGISIGVLTLGAAASTGKEQTHTVKLSLMPKETATGGSVRVSRKAGS